VYIKIIPRVALLFTCLLVFLPGGHIALPMGIGFLRFLNPQFSPELRDWVILWLLANSITISVVSIRHAPRVLVICSIASYSALIVLVQLGWANPQDSMMYITAIPFLGVSIWCFVQSFFEKPTSAMQKRTSA
jgi:hypothetical protein